MPTPIANTFFQQAFYQETPDAYWRLSDREGYDQAVIGDRPSGYWREADAVGSPTLADASGNGATATVFGGVTLGQGGPIADGGKAAAFDGSTGYATASVPALGAAFSFESWFLTSTGAEQHLVEMAPGNLYIQNGPFILGFNGGVGGNLMSPAVVNDGLWHHAVGTYDGTNARLYLDGVLVVGPVARSWSITGSVAYIGRFTGGADFFRGRLSRSAVYAYALSAAQIAAHYALRVSGLSGLTAPSVVDITLNSNDGAAHGPVQFAQAGWSGDTDTAMTFGGGYLDVGNVAALGYTGRFSVVAAFKTSGNGAVMTIVSKALSAGPQGWGLVVDAAGKPRFYAYTSAGVAVFDITSSTAYQDNAWHLVVAAYDPVVAKLATLYVDGVLKASATPSGVPDANAARVLIGAVDNAGVAAQLFSGGLDEVVLYGYAFRAAQVTALTGARTTMANGKALMQARAGVLRAGAGRSGYYTARTIVLLNGVDVTANLWKQTLQVTEQPNEQADTARCTLFDVSGSLMPSYGQTLIVADGSADNRVYGGTVVRLTRRSVKNPNGTAVNITLFDLELNDWTWLLNRRTVTKSYPAGMLAHLVVIDLIATYTAGFTVAHVQTSAPALTAPLVFRGTKVAAALSAVTQATAPNWKWYVDANLDVHYFLTETSQRPRALAPGNSTYDRLNYTLDLTAIRTRMVVEGGGASLTAPATIGATSLTVDECGKYSASGGTVVAPEGILITYTGISASSGPGSLTGIPASGAGSVSVPLLQGDGLNVWVIVDDLAAQAALGALELDPHGNPTDGIHEQPLTVTDGTIAQCQQAANAELAAYRTAIVTGTVWSRDKLMKTGKVLSIALPARGISVDVTIQQVTRSLMTVNTWQFDVTFATVWRNLVDVLKRVGKAA